MQGRFLIILLATISASATLDSQDYESLRTFFSPQKRKDQKIFLDATVVGIYKNHKDFVKKIMKARLNNQKIESPIELANTLNGLSKKLGEFNPKSLLSNEQIELYIATLMDVFKALDHCENSSAIWSNSCGTYKKHFKVDLEDILPKKQEVVEKSGDDVKLYIKIDHDNNSIEQAEKPEVVSEEKDVKLYIKIHMDEKAGAVDPKDIAEQILEKISESDKHDEIIPKDDKEEEEDLPEDLPEHSIIGSLSDIGNEDDLSDFAPPFELPKNSPTPKHEKLIDSNESAGAVRPKSKPYNLLPGELNLLFAEKKQKNQPSELLPGELSHLLGEKKQKNGSAELLPGELNQLYAQKKDHNEPADLLEGELSRLFAEKKQKNEPAELLPWELNRLFAEKREKNEPVDLLAGEINRLFAEKKQKNEAIKLLPWELNRLFAEKKQKNVPADLLSGEINRLFAEKKQKNEPAELLPWELNRLFAEKREKNEPVDLLPGEINRLFAEKKQKNEAIKLLPNDLRRLFPDKKHKNEPAILQPGELHRLYPEKREKLVNSDIDISDLFDEPANEPEEIQVPEIKRAYSRINVSDSEDEEEKEPETPEQFDIKPTLVNESTESIDFVGPRRRFRKVILIEPINCAKCLNDGPLSDFIQYLEVLKR